MAFIIEVIIIFAMFLTGLCFPEMESDAALGILVLIAMDMGYIAYKIDKIIKDKD